MTQISGEIYQMKNAAGTLNRFPRTVLEAVIGLPSYLQQQFALLSDIYMPIEGINQAKPNQEFVYRKTPNTINAKALTLDKIKGKTLAWNQLIPSDTGGEIVGGSGITFTRNADGSLTINGTASGYAYNNFGGAEFIAGHKYLTTIGDSGYTGLDLSAYTSAVNVDTGYGNASSIRTAGITTYSNIGVFIYEGYSFDNIKIYPQIIDLTRLYGSDIDGMTDAQILAKYESEYGGFHPFNDGDLISNDAESLESVGFNKWDEEWVTGGYYDISGTWQVLSVLSDKNGIKVLPNTDYYIRQGSTDYSIAVTFWDANGNFISRSSAVGTTIITTPANCYLIHFNCNQAYGLTYNHDICINISDPTRNGQYEPYRKSTMQLGLNSIKVKSHNIWDEEWEEGGIDRNGDKTTASNTIRTKNYNPCIAGATYYVKATELVIYFYDANKIMVPFTGQGAYLNGLDITYGNTFVVPNGVCYFRFRAPGYGSTYNNDICINLSSSFNGQYEPYGDITITGGLKSAGSVYDEIVGNKFVKRVGRCAIGDLTGYRESTYFVFHKEDAASTVYTNCVCSAYKTVNGIGEDKGICCRIGSNKGFVIKDSAYDSFNALKTAKANDYIDYALATPIEYDLAEPLPTSMPAGTTEARISHNADGLSAPFCADITYGMGATDYAQVAGVAEYAMSAQVAECVARLLNPRTIWGQSFDGSANLSGPMSGVTNIDSLAYFDTSNGRIGIGISTPLYNLDVAGTFHAAGNVEIGGTLISRTNPFILHSIASYGEVEIDSETELTLNCFDIDEDGNAAFETASVRDCLRLRHYDVEERDFSDSDVSFDGDHVSFENPLSAPRYDTSSDERLKTDFKDIELTVEQIAAAPAVEFKWKGNGQPGAGSIAQYWENTLPYNVHSAGGTLSMEYGNIALISAIVCARKIQELEEQVKKLEAKLNV